MHNRAHADSRSKAAAVAAAVVVVATAVVAVVVVAPSRRPALLSPRSQTAYRNLEPSIRRSTKSARVSPASRTGWKFSRFTR